MSQEIKFTKYEERGACHIREAKKSIRYFNAEQQARFDLILKYLGDIKNKTVLDVGCGDGALTYLFCKKQANVVGADVEELGLKFAKEFLSSHGYHPQLILTSAYNIPLEDNSVDCVVASDVIEHVQEPDRLLEEAKRILKPGGKIVISTPYKLTEKSADKFHVKEYYPAEIKRLVGQYFTQVEIKETHEAFWHVIYSKEFSIPKIRRLMRYVINVMCLYFKKNPFMKDAEHRKKWDFFTQIFVIANKDS